MIEIALALGVIGFALVAIIGVLPAGMSVQKDNRESTLVNFDANFLLNAITTGSTGLDDLTNHIISITNYVTVYNAHGAAGNQYVIAYTTTNTSVSGNATLAGPPYLTNGQNIIALLTIPKYIPYGPNGSYYSNYATADFRAFSSSLADQGTSQSAQSFAFAYRLYPEVVPFYATSGIIPSSVNPNSDLVAFNFQNNFTQVRLRFRWPIFPNGGVGNSRLTFRTAVSGAINYMPEFPALAPGGEIIMSNALFQPGTYVGQ
jgi:hypothetical protein